MPTPTSWSTCALRGVSWTATWATRASGTVSSRSRESPTTSTSLAVLTALESLDISSVVLLSPYDHEIAEREVGWLVANGVSVVDHQHLDIRDNLKRGAFPPEQSLRHALALDWASADGIFLSCANIPYAEIVDDLGASTGRLVVTSSMATTWHALGMAGVVTALDRRA